MISLSFHWSWLLIAAILVVAIIIASHFCKDSSGPAGGLGVVIGCFAIVIALFVIAVIGGIFIW